MKQREIKHLKKGAVGIVLLVCVICYSAGGCREQDRTKDYGVFGPERAEAVDLETDESVSAGGQEAHPGSNLDPDAGAHLDSALNAGLSGNTAGSENPGVYSPAGEAGGGAAGEQFQKTEGSRLIYVHVCGEAKDPGVYGLAEGSRVYQAVEAAGGLTDEASEESLNMALPLEDGLQVYVPDQEEAKELGAGAVTEAGAGFLSRGLIPGAAAAAVPGPLEKSRVNINTATREELMTLTGIGASRADAILAYRREAGPFQKIEDIMKVSGIKEAAFQKIKEDITV